MKHRGVLTVLFSFWCLFEAAAHELWLEPLNWQTIPDQEIRVSVLLGSEMTGGQQIYMPASFRRFELVTPSGTIPVSGRMGDRPAGRVAPKENGPHYLVYETTPRLVKYNHLDKFTAFAREKGYGKAEDQHRAGNLPLSSFVERYTRHVKSLIRVGNGAEAVSSGNGRRLGLDVEFIARKDPYSWQGGSLIFGLEVDGVARANARVTLMRRKSGTPDAPVHKAFLVTGPDGQIEIEPVPGHIYLLDHVDLARADADAADGAVWVSRWGALTFLVP